MRTASGSNGPVANYDDVLLSNYDVIGEDTPKNKDYRKPAFQSSMSKSSLDKDGEGPLNYDILVHRHTDSTASKTNPLLDSYSVLSEAR